MFILSPLFLGPFGRFSIRSRAWETKWSREQVTLPMMMIATPITNSPTCVVAYFPNHLYYIWKNMLLPWTVVRNAPEFPEAISGAGYNCRLSHSPTLPPCSHLLHPCRPLSLALGVCCFKAPCVGQSEASIQVTWSLSTNEKQCWCMVSLSGPGEQLDIANRH